MTTAPSDTSQAALAGAEAGSFRDPASRIFYAGGSVYRALTPDGLADFEALTATKLFDGAVADGRLVGTERVEDTGSLPDLLVHERAGVLRHERIPFVSYPYEWPFSMLRDAALLQLDLLEASLREGLTLKDASSYNVQFRGAQPTFVDIGSFERRRAGEGWLGYRQFCMLFLYPLMLQAHKDVGYHGILRGQIDGISPRQMRNLSCSRDRFRRGYPSNVFIHARLEARYAGRAAAVKRRMKQANIDRDVLLAQVAKLREVVRRLEWDPPHGVWVAYGERNSYTDSDARRKDEFVREVATSRRWPLTWDIGANNGRYSRIAAEGSDYVLALDADQGAIELLYRGLREDGARNILALTMNLADQSPGLGWRGAERKELAARGRPDLVLALALIHHTTVTANVPVAEFVDWLASLGTSLVIEFPTREDPMVQQLLSGKREGLHPDYERENFERVLADAFDVERRERLASGTRLLYFARPKGSGSPVDLTATAG